MLIDVSLRDVLSEVFFQTFKKTSEFGQTWRVKDVNENADECSVSWITSHFYTHRVDATKHLEPMEWVNFQAGTVLRESVGASKPSSP